MPPTNFAPQFENAMCHECNRRVGLNKIKLLTSICGHDLCEDCHRTKFQHRGTVKCTYAGCGEELVKQHYQPKMFEAGLVQRSVYVRRHMLRSFNSTLETFKGNLAQYNDYLETVEDLAFNLTYNFHDPAIVAKCMNQIKTYEKVNERMIQANLQRQARELTEKQNRYREEKRKRLKLLEERRRKHGEPIKEKREEIVNAILSGKINAHAGMNQLKALHRKQEESINPADEQSEQMEESEPKDSAVFGGPASREDTTEKFTYPGRSGAVSLCGSGALETPAFVAMRFGDQLATSILKPEETIAGGLSPDVIARRAIMDACDCLFVQCMQ
eukprot:m.323438 g.323438  ORF g.323438 m.323438 type:complete len:329 (-) comp16538_c1_seq40:1832-2818(-)